MGKIVPSTTFEKQTGLPYQPTPRDRQILQIIDDLFDRSKVYWEPIHTWQKRLFVKFLNGKLQAAKSGIINLAYGRFFYLIDVIHSFLSDVLLNEKPLGKVSGVGSEDYEGAQNIDKVHRVQLGNGAILDAFDNALLYANCCGTGYVSPGWRSEEEPILVRKAVTYATIDPMNPSQTVEQPTGEYEEIDDVYLIDEIDAACIEPWRVFLEPGAQSPQDGFGYCVIVDSNRAQLHAWQNQGYIQNVEFIDPGFYGLDYSDSDTSEKKIKDTTKEGKQGQYIDKDFIQLLFYYGKLPSEDGSGDLTEHFAIKTLKGDVLLKETRNKFAGQKRPLIPVKHMGIKGLATGIGPGMILEQLIYADELSLNLMLERGIRETINKILVVEGWDTSKLQPSSLETIVPVPREYAEKNLMPREMERQPNVLPALTEVRAVFNQLFTEIAPVLDFIKADMTATEVNRQFEMLGKRLRKRMKYIEAHALLEWMHWQTALNCQFLTNEDVARICNIMPIENPFQFITPTIPIRSVDFIFEGSQKAIDNPVRAQIIKDFIKSTAGLPPGVDVDGQLKQINILPLVKEFAQTCGFETPIDQIFVPYIPPLVDPNANPESGERGGKNLGATTVGDLLAGLPNPTQNINMNPEQRG